MKREINYCDWCEVRKAIVIIAKGEDKNDYLCESCEEEFLEILRNEYLNDMDDKDNGDWRLAKIKLIKKDKREENEREE